MCYISATVGWLNPGALVIDLESRADRMVVRCAQRLAKFGNQKEGIYSYLKTLMHV